MKILPKNTRNELGQGVFTPTNMYTNGVISSTYLIILCTLDFLDLLFFLNSINATKYTTRGR